jgi:hypothetical protein
MKESWQNTKYGKAKEQWTTSVSSRRIDMHQKHEEDGEDLPERGHFDNEEEHKTNANMTLHTGSSSSQRNTVVQRMTCKKWVYWQDIPSDCYVSPFHSKHSQESVIWYVYSFIL